jgi:hypothetical protein
LVDRSTEREIWGIRLHGGLATLHFRGSDDQSREHLRMSSSASTTYAEHVLTVVFFPKARLRFDETEVFSEAMCKVA